MPRDRDVICWLQFQDNYRRKLIFFPVDSRISQRNWCRNKILTVIFPFESSDNCLGTVVKNDVTVTWYCHTVIEDDLRMRIFNLIDSK